MTEAISRAECETKMADMADTITDSVEINAIMQQENMNQYQVQAYERLKMHQERMKKYSLIFKIFSILDGTIAVLLGLLTAWL